MTGIAAAPDSADTRFDRWFWRIVLIGSVVLLLAGVGGFSYLRVKSPLALLGGSDRPIAAASALVPASSPFTVSLLTEPERLLALQQAIVRPAQRDQARRETEQVQQHLQQVTGLSYERDIQPWLGQEITFAYTDRDLDRDLGNGQQPGYLLIFEIAPGRYEQAQSFLQLFWQRQAIVGNVPAYETVSGVKLLASQNTQAASLTAASALVGRQFVMFANDARILRSSIRAAQTAQNLAQSPAYRQRVAALPDQRIGLMYLDARLLSAAKSPAQIGDSSEFAAKSKAQFVAIGLDAKRDGLMAIAQIPTSDALKTSSSGGRTGSLWDSALVDSLPAESELVIVGRDVDELRSAWAIAGLPDDLLPKFMGLGQSSIGSSASIDSSASSSISSSASASSYGQSGKGYALSRVRFGQSPDWILAVPRDMAQIAALDQAAMTAGYSVVPVAMDSEGEATAWTRFTAKGGKRSTATTSANRTSSRTSSGLESELLGLHLQQGDIEIFASSLGAMDSALEGRVASLPQFAQVTAPLRDTNSDAYVYLDWPRIEPTLGQLFPALTQIQTVASPLANHIDAIAASRDGETVRLFIQLAD